MSSSSREELIKPQTMPMTNNFGSTGVESDAAPKLTGPGARTQLYRDRIEAMTIDNSSLQRRLN
jgi:hypothetical protein